jgi:hypothetical protein
MQYLSGLPRDNACSTLLRWLTGRDIRRSNLATKLMAQAGKASTALLLSEALAARKSQHQRIRLLAAIEQVAHPLDPQQWLMLVSQLRRFKGEVVDQIRDLILWNQRQVAAPAK